MMLNIEQNKTIYNANGNLNNANLAKKPFNQYVYNQIDNNMNVSIGIIVVYDNNSFVNPGTSNTIINSIKNKLAEIDQGNFNTKRPISVQSYKSTHYTLLSKKPDNDRSTSTSAYGTSYRKIIDNWYSIKKCCENGTAFVWLLYNIHPKNINNYLHIAELTNQHLSNNYLSRSISTIIYDSKDVFNVSNMTKQLDYPSLNQYRMFNQNQILDQKIYISQIFGLDYEIMNHYDTSNFVMYHENGNKLETIKSVKCEDFKIRRRDPKKIWYKQLAMSYNYDEQEQAEQNIDESGKPSFPNNICFITGTPLYQNAYLLHLKHKELKENISQGKNQEKTSYILISQCLFYCLIKDSKYDLSFNMTLSVQNLKLLDQYIVNFDRTEYEVIKMIPDKSISPLKRDIMLSISKNGCYRSKDILYTINLEKNIIYVGLTKFYDSDIIKYQNTNTILFHYYIH